MTAAVENMAFAHQVPWHGLGKQVRSDMTPKQMLKAAGLDWTVSKREMFLKGNKKVPDKYALCRDTDDRFLSIVGKTYKPVQNEVALDFFKRFVEAGNMTMETAGSLWDGRYIWGLARIGVDFNLGKQDEVRGYLLVSQPHVIGRAMVIQFTTIRVVCWNTLTFALGAGLKGGVGAFRQIHAREFDEHAQKAAEETLGLASDQMKQFKEAAILLSKKKAKGEQVDEYFCEVLRFDPKKAKKEGKRTPHSLPKFQAALTHAPGQALPSALGTWWGAYNAVSYVIDHETGRDRGTALRNAWIGHTANIKRRALTIALDRAA